MKTQLYLPTTQATCQVRVSNQPQAMCMSASTPGIVVVAAGHAIEVVDTKMGTVAARIPAAHQGAVRTVDLGGKASSTLLTGGDDGAVRWWDMRYVQKRCFVL